MTDETAAPQADGQQTPEPEAKESEATEQVEQQSEQSDGDAETEQQPKKDGTAKFIRKLKGQLKASEAELKKLRELAQQAQSQPPSEAKAPVMDDFDSVEDFTKALVAHEMKKSKGNDTPQDWDTEVQQARANAERESWNEQVEDLGKPDFYDKVAATPFSDEMADVLLAYENGAEIAYWLANNRAVATQIARETDPTAVAIALGRVEAEMSSPQPTGKKVTTAPKPIESVKPSGSTVGGDPLDPSIDINQWMKNRNKQLRGR